MLLSSLSKNDASQSHIDSVKLAILRESKCDNLSDEVKIILIEKYLPNVKDVPDSLRFEQIIGAEFGCFNDHEDPYLMCPEEMVFATNYWGAYNAMMLFRQNLDTRNPIVRHYILGVWRTLSDAGVMIFEVDVKNRQLLVDRNFEVAGELLERSGIQSIKTHGFGNNIKLSYMTNTANVPLTRID